MLLRLALAQINVTVGDVEANQRLIGDAILRAKAWRSDAVLLPELAITGYPPEDLLLKSQFIDSNLNALKPLALLSRGIVSIVGFVDKNPKGELFNAAAVLHDGRILAVYHKQCLPNYGVFDEKRYFTPGKEPLLISIGGIRIGLSICEDLWESRPLQVLARSGAQLVVNLSASPYHAGKQLQRQGLFSRQAKNNGLAIAHCNLIGGQDELVFDGTSFVLDRTGKLLVNGIQFREDLLLCDIPSEQLGKGSSTRAHALSVEHSVVERPPIIFEKPIALSGIEEVYEALILGLRDYVRKNGFSTVVLGLSGGIDSALTACIAADALGYEHVVGVIMPSRFSSGDTQNDAKRVASALGIRVEEISIEPTFESYLSTLEPHFKDQESDTTEQNMQARIRGNLLMALSNKFGWLVLTTGNKSEMATGYATLYGDMAGGLAVIKDVPKTLVYKLARFRNKRGDGLPIPESVLRREPTAELAPNQKDTDTLPPYEALDKVIKAYVEEDKSLRGIVEEARIDERTVKRVIQMVDRAEYKRRQSPPGIKITPRAFGKDRRMPITNRYSQI